MALNNIINDLADQADDFLDGVSNRAEARAAISEQITITYPKLNGIERTKVTDGVLAILEEEGFFDLVHGDGSDEDGAGDGAEE